MLRNCVYLELARGVGWGWWHSLNLNTWWMLRNSVCLVIAHMVDATQLCLSCHCTPRRCYATVFILNLHVGWGGDDDILWTWTHGGCYATVFVLSLHTWWMLRNSVCLVIAHMVDATCKVNGQKKLAGTQVLDRTWMWMKQFIPHSIKNRGNSVLNPRLWDYVYQFVYRHNKDLWETTWRSKTTFCVVIHISRTSYKNRKTSDCVVNHMILDYANVWHHRASRRRVTLFLH